MESFSEAVDRYFSQMEAKKGENALEVKEKQAVKRMDQIKRDQQQRLAGLEQVRDNKHLYFLFTPTHSSFFKSSPWENRKNE